MPFGIDDSVAADYLCRQKSNEKWKAQNKFVQFVQFVVKKINASLSAKHG